MAEKDEDAPDYEDEHVHAVYDQIASHFSSTRYKPWPIVERFLRNLAPGSVGLDVGCGNGKYLTVNRDIFIVGSDRSPNLVQIASQHSPHSAIIADTLCLPHQPSTFDFALSIAVIHHLSTPARRTSAIRALLETLRPPTHHPTATTLPPTTPIPTRRLTSSSGGKALIFVWALEQKSSRRGWTADDAQDVMVPWVTKTGGRQSKQGEQKEEVFHRYYHLYRAGELEAGIRAAGGVVLDAGYERDNWWAVAARGPGV